MTQMTRALRAALLASAVLAPTGAYAQDATQLPTVDVETTGEVQAGKPLAGTTVSAETLRGSDATSSDTAGILTALPGVSANGGGGFSSMPTIRGLSEQRIKVLVDGQPIDAACPNDMNSPLSYTMPQTLSSVTVIPGVAPVSMGGDNIGGVISVAAAEPRFSTDGTLLLTGEASAFYRSNGDGFGGAVTVTAAGSNLSATYTGSYTQSDNYDGGGSKGEVRSTEYAKTDHALALAWQNEAGLWEIKGGYHFSPYEGFANQWMDMTSNKSWFVQGRYRGVFDWGDVDISASYRDTDHKMNFLADKLPGDMPMNTEVHTFTSAAKFSVPVTMRDTLKFGLEYHHQWLDDYWPPVEGSMMMGPDTFVNINQGHRNRIGAYAEWQAQWSDTLSSVVGVRYDRVEMNTGDVQPYGTSMMQMADVMAAAMFNSIDRNRNDNNWSASAIVTWAPADTLAIELGYAHKARSPNIYERYTWGRGSMASRMIGWFGDGNGYVGNPDLKPERADTFSATLSLTPAQGVSLKVSPYYTRVNDYIDAVYLQDLLTPMGMPTDFVQLQFANLDAEFYGVDLSGEAVLAGTRENGTMLSGSLAWVHGQNLTEDLPLYHQMPFNAKLGVSHRQGAFELGGEVEWVDRKDRVDPRRNEPETASYALVNLRAAYTLAGWRLSVEAENLLDKGYDLPLGGVAIGDYKNTGILRPVAGRGRSVNLGISTKF
ncbi:TonB-dependent receptor plug domain-containing protein [Novosphingobium mangrovi (ex Huang et al. 2023)]|uniref:TonB-dependent receptor n=1 Tax=Novosphingobium mangrovi (ex Huang et al. 2023) TaxID=2976432 RepID=A0ABT2I6D4_9SPHN|nr:TonB-dependent receptor [Novosphingobium mangrovi (ex Huang et al. 2023)]MCT2400372.1 TonB-dependent receptor [Novosphingobium mangrovi (ex Huang et al. 2023)]